MKIRLKNIGRIENSEVEIKTITVIAGENGSGKSTIGKALFGVFNSLFNVREKIKQKRENELKKGIKDFSTELAWKIYTSDKKETFPFERIMTRIDEMLQNMMHIEIFGTFLQNGGATREDIKNVALSFFEKFANGDNELSQLSFEFFLQSSFFERIAKVLGFSDIEMIYELVTQNIGAEFNNQVSNIFTNNKDSEIELELKGENLSVKLIDNITHHIEGFRMLQRLFYIDDPFVLDELNNPLYGVSHRTVLKNYLKLDQKTNLFDSLDGRKNLSSILELFNDVCEGSLERENANFYYSTKKHSAKLDIRNIATGMKTFVILKTLIQRGFIQENGTIVLDEPEIHLHPDWQLKLAEIIVVLQKVLGLHILINTHSPYFLDAIETYSIKYEVQDVKFYSVQIDNDFTSTIHPVLDTDEIYTKLAEPFQKLEDTRWIE